MPSTANVERVLSLALTLAATERGLTRDELLQLVPGYGDGSPESRRRQLVRDLSRLGKIGLEVHTAADPFMPNLIRYRIMAETGDPHTFTPSADERAVLAAASAMWSTSRASGLAARVRSKLAAAGIPVNLSRVHGTIGVSPAFDPLVEAAAEERAVSFSYRRSPGDPVDTRVLEPWHVGVHSGREYVLGFDRLRQAPRLFRVSRILNTPKDEGPARAVKDDTATIVSALTERHASECMENVRVYAEPYKALSLRRFAGASPDASSFSVEACTSKTILSHALSEAQWVHLSGNAPVVEEWNSIRERIAAAHAKPSRLSLAQYEELPATKRPKLRAVSSSENELTRLSAEAAFVYEHGPVEFDYMAQHFGLSMGQLERDLRTLVSSADYSMGIDNVVDVQWDSGIVSICGADVLSRPLALTPSEAAALLLGVEALDAIDSGLPAEAILNVRTLLAGVLGAHRLADPASASTERDDSPLVSDWITRACEDQSVVRIMYSSPSRHGVSVRDIEPLGLLSMYGTVYIEAHCLLTDSIREFRADRIVGEWDPNAPEAPQTGDFTRPAAGVALTDERILVSATAAGGWVFDAFEAHDQRYSDETGLTYAAITTATPHALVAAVFESQGAIEVLAPQQACDAVHAIAVARASANQE